MRQPNRDRVSQLKDLGAYEGIAQVAGAFADPIRLEIVEALAQSARSVESLAEICGLPQKNISYHLQRLRAGGIVKRIAIGRHGVYSLADNEVAAVWSSLRGFTERHLPLPAEGHREKELTRDDLERLVNDRAVTLIDVRPAQEFASGHLPGALSVPLHELDTAIAQIPRDLPVVAYCRGPYCKMASKAIEILSDAGYAATRFADGLVEWKGAGLDLVESDDHFSP